VISTLIVASLTWILLRSLGLELPFIYCLLFGALISPTDPIAVLGILKSANAPKTLETKITGESLFNDGVGVVIFIVLLDIVRGGHDLDPAHVLVFFLQEAVGGSGVWPRNGFFGLLDAKEPGQLPGGDTSHHGPGHRDLCPG